MEPRLWLVMGVLVLVLMLASYATGVRPSSTREWRLIAVTLTFLFWLLGGFSGLRS